MFPHSVVVFTGQSEPEETGNRDEGDMKQRFKTSLVLRKHVTGAFPPVHAGIDCCPGYTELMYVELQRLVT